MALCLSDNSLGIQIVLRIVYFILGGLFRNATHGAALSQQTLTLCPEKIHVVYDPGISFYLEPYSLYRSHSVWQ